MKYTNWNILKIGTEPVFNRSFKFLGPQINKILSVPQLKLFSQLEWLGFAIYDENYPDDEFNLHCIFKAEENISYQLLLDNQYYVRDYPLDANNHVIVYNFAINNIFYFLNGDYTKMYTEKELNEYFITTVTDEMTNIEYFSDVYSILSGLEEYTESFINQINEEFDSEITINELVKKELDYPPLLSQEVLNYTQKGKSNILKANLHELEGIFSVI